MMHTIKQWSSLNNAIKIHLQLWMAPLLAEITTEWWLCFAKVLRLSEAIWDSYVIHQQFPCTEWWPGKSKDVNEMPRLTSYLALCQIVFQCIVFVKLIAKEAQIAWHPVIFLQSLKHNIFMTTPVEKPINWMYISWYVTETGGISSQNDNTNVTYSSPKPLKKERTLPR